MNWLQRLLRGLRPKDEATAAAPGATTAVAPAAGALVEQEVQGAVTTPEESPPSPPEPSDPTR